MAEGLWLVVAGGSRLWELRFKSPVTDKRRQIEGGLDPIMERKKEKAVSNVDMQDVLTALRQYGQRKSKQQAGSSSSHPAPSVKTDKNSGP